MGNAVEMAGGWHIYFSSNLAFNKESLKQPFCYSFSLSNCLNLVKVYSAHQTSAKRGSIFSLVSKMILPCWRHNRGMRLDLGSLLAHFRLLWTKLKINLPFLPLNLMRRQKNWQILSCSHSRSNYLPIFAIQIPGEFWHYENEFK